MQGGCACGTVRYGLSREPIIVHCCHCRWCQRETGSAFAVNAMIEAGAVSLLAGEPEMTATPSESGKGQKIWRCPTCRVAVWSNYAGAGDGIRFVRVGTLDEPERVPPDIHIYTESRQGWVVIPGDARQVGGYYDAREVWSAEGLARFKAARAGR